MSDVKKYSPQKQDDALACYAQKIDKAECLLDFTQSVDALYNKIRAFSPYPAMYFEYNGERFKIIRAEKGDVSLPVGTIKQAGNELHIGVSGGSLNITQIQRQGKRTMSIAELLRGYSFK